jgi:ubiquinone biosynthesis protein UbiJ
LSERVKLPIPFLAGIETAINRYLELDPEVIKRLAELEGRVIQIDLKGINATLYLLPGSGNIQVLGSYENDADTCISGTPLALLQMGMVKNVQKSLFSGDVEISGDTELGQTFKQILDDMDIDWEEHLSHITGDIIAHQAGKLVRETLQWGKKAMDTIGQDLSEYLQEEIRAVATQHEVEDFLENIDTLREDTDRLDARVRRIYEKLPTEHHDFKSG